MNLIHGDALHELKRLNDDSIDLAITSPPYDGLRDYGVNPEWDFAGIALELVRALKVGGVIVWVVADQVVDGSETGTSFKHALHFKYLGLRLHDTMIWNKKHAPFQHSCRYPNVFEYMFVLSKGKPKTAKLIKDRLNKWRGTQIHGSERQLNGKTKPLSAVQKQKTVKDMGARHNIWEINPEKNSKAVGHPAMFPVELPVDHIRTWTNRDDTVLDPFMGSGTTGLACRLTNRRFIGIELNKEYFDIATRRIEAR